MSSLKTISIGHINRPRTVKYSASCNEFVTRLDFETSILPGGEIEPLISGLRLHCAGQADPFPLNYINLKQVFLFQLTQVPGHDVPTGVRDMQARWNDHVLTSLGYGKSVAGSATGTNRWIQAWERAGLEDVTMCVLKGVELQVADAVEGAVLIFDCNPPPPPAPRSLPAAATSLPASNPSFLSSDSPNPPTTTLPLPILITTVVIMPTSFTTTLTIGSGANVTVITTIIQPTPFLSILSVAAAPAATNIVVHSGSPAVFTTFDSSTGRANQAAVDDGDSATLLGFLIGLIAAQLLAGIVIGALLFTRRRKAKQSSRPKNIELVDMGPTADVDPPAYVVSPITELVVVMTEELPGKESVKHAKTLREDGDDEEDGELHLPGSTSVADSRF